ncbi:MAG: YveK family protein [Sarcina sp.]
MEEEVIKLEDIFSAIKKRWLMIFLITLTFTVTAGLISYYVMKPEYQTRVKVFIGKEGAGTGNIDTSQYNSSDILMYQNLMKTYAEIVKSKDSVKNALGSITQSTSTGNINRVLAGLTVSPSADTQIMEVSYKTKNKAEILPVINSVIREFEKKSKELIPNGNIQIIETAEIPENPIGPNKQLNIIIGFMLGMMVSLGIVFLLEYLNNTVKNAQELEKILAVPVLGTIPDVDEKKLAKREKKARKLNTKN